jgi:hypothetical protein
LQVFDKVHAAEKPGSSCTREHAAKSLPESWDKLPESSLLAVWDLDGENDRHSTSSDEDDGE